MKNKKYSKGFASIILIIFVSSLMLALNYSQYIEYGHFFDLIQKKQYRLMNYYSAYSCIDQAILMLSHDFFLLTDENINFNEFNCVIDSITISDSNINDRIISVFGNYKNIIVYRKATVRLFDDHLEIISIQ